LIAVAADAVTEQHKDGEKTATQANVERGRGLKHPPLLSCSESYNPGGDNEHGLAAGAPSKDTKLAKRKNTESKIGRDQHEPKQKGDVTPKQLIKELQSIVGLIITKPLNLSDLCEFARIIAMAARDLQKKVGLLLPKQRKRCTFSTWVWECIVGQCDIDNSSVLGGLRGKDDDDDERPDNNQNVRSRKRKNVETQMCENGEVVGV
jgi:hypothetical protein